MSNRPSNGNLGANPGGRQVRGRLVSIVMVLLGLMLTPFSIFLARHLLEGPFDGMPELVSSVMMALSMLCSAWLGVSLVLFPLRNTRWLGPVVRAILTPSTAAIEWLHRYYSAFAAPILVLCMSFFWPRILLTILIRTGMDPRYQSASYYLSFLVTSIGIINYTQSMVGRVLRWATSDRYDYSRVLDTFRPARVRVYVYGLVACGYILANVERLIGKAWLPYPQQIKDLALEVLLTFVSVDAVRLAVKEMQDSKSAHDKDKEG